jgi:hypothetical protein
MILRVAPNPRDLERRDRTVSAHHPHPVAGSEISQAEEGLDSDVPKSIERCSSCKPKTPR